jgi:hypothetical protein
MAGRRQSYVQGLGGGSGVAARLRRCGLSRYDEDAEELRELDEGLALSLMDLVRLSVKVSGSDSGTETALVEALKRMEALCAKLEAGEWCGRREGGRG